MRFNENAFKKNLGSNNVWFIGSSCDMFARKIPREWIKKTLNHLIKYPNNTYLLQTKNPKRFLEFIYPLNDIILGTTLETNKDELALEYSDAVVINCDTIDPAIQKMVEESGKPVLPYPGTEDYVDAFDNFYNKDVPGSVIGISIINSSDSNIIV